MIVTAPDLRFQLCAEPGVLISAPEVQSCVSSWLPGIVTWKSPQQLTCTPWGPRYAAAPLAELLLSLFPRGRERPLSALKWTVL